MSGTMTGANRYVMSNWTEEFNLIYYLKQTGSTLRSTYFSSQFMVTITVFFLRNIQNVGTGTLKLL
jgi:hypothetical protein